MRILIAEDDPDIRERLSALLTAENFLVDACADGSEAMQLGLENDYAAVLLDFGLPIFSGEQVMARWKRAERRFPVIAVTGTRNTREQMRELIALGIDQYVSKPIMDYDLLIDWIRARVNERRPGPHGTLICRGKLEIDTESLTIRHDGRPLRKQLSPKQFAVLRELALDEGAAISARAIAARAFDESDGPKEMDVRTHIARINEKFGFALIVNVGAAQGYRLDA